MSYLWLLVPVMCLSLLPAAAFATDADVQRQATPGIVGNTEGDNAGVQAFLDAVDSIEVPEED